MISDWHYIVLIDDKAHRRLVEERIQDDATRKDRVDKASFIMECYMEALAEDPEFLLEKWREGEREHGQVLRDLDIQTELLNEAADFILYTMILDD